MKIDMDFMALRTNKSILAKKAKTNYPVHELITKRWSARSFSDDPIDSQKIYTLFEAASWAASSMNEQPWRYKFAIRDDTMEFKKFHNCLFPGNKPWSSSAAVIILSLAKKFYSRTGSINKHYFHDVGAANNNLLLQAASMDIYGHMMAGFDEKKTIETFTLPPDLEPVCFIVLGYLDQAEKLEEPYLSRELQERSRKRLEEIIL
jgi:nitroreductase